MLRNLSSRRRQLLASTGAAVGALALAGAAAGLATDASAGPAPAAASGNLLTNPGFESGDLSGWTCDAGTAAVLTSPVRSGSHSLTGTPSGSATAQCTQTVSVQPNTAYTFSGYVEGSYVYIGLTGGTSTWTPSATSWQQLSVSFTTGATQTSVQVYVHGWYAQPAYHADDLALTGPAGPPPTTPSSSATTPTTTPTTPPTTPTTTPSTTPPTTPSTPSTSSSSSSPGGSTCAVKSRPSGAAAT